MISARTFAFPCSILVANIVSIACRLSFALFNTSFKMSSALTCPCLSMCRLSCSTICWFDNCPLANCFAIRCASLSPNRVARSCLINCCLSADWSNIDFKILSDEVCVRPSSCLSIWLAICWSVFPFVFTCFIACFASCWLITVSKMDWAALFLSLDCCNWLSIKSCCWFIRCSVWRMSCFKACLRWLSKSLCWLTSCSNALSVSLLSLM